MTDEEFDILQRVAKEAMELKKIIFNCPGDHPDYPKLCQEYDEFDAVTCFPKKQQRSTKEKIIDIRKYVLQQSKGHVVLTDETINGVITKAVL